MADLHVPAGWPGAVAPPGTDQFVPSAINWLYDLVPDLRRHPVILAAIAKHVTAGAADGARAGYRDEGRRLVAAAHGAELIERALRGGALQPARPE